MGDENYDLCFRISGIAIGKLALAQPTKRLVDDDARQHFWRTHTTIKKAIQFAAAGGNSWPSFHASDGDIEEHGFVAIVDKVRKFLMLRVRIDV
ncbi:MAG: hypothetical protein EOR99_33525 [Mesorhizobium sp.]|nr:MAG: hypothetical protein EOR99_33525 [Mesorhizobium sp.]